MTFCRNDPRNIIKTNKIFAQCCHLKVISNAIHFLFTQLFYANSEISYAFIINQFIYSNARHMHTALNC